MMGLVARARSWLSGVRGSRLVNADMEEEFRFHMELRAAELQRGGVPADEAMRRARAEFGGVHNFTQLGREARGLAWFDAVRFSWLDFKLGGRMIAKYPGLTVMAALAIGVAVAIGAGVCGAISTIRSSDLPLDEGDRVVGIQLLDIKSRSPERRLVRDFAEWRTGLRSVVDIGAFRPAFLNLVGPAGRGEPLRGVEMSAAGFRVTRVPPLLGRYLVDDDERPSAASVVVLGYDVWRSRFNADTSVVGRSVRVGNTLHTIVGVMPERFAFPVNYSMWVPLRLDHPDYERRAGPALFVFGRLAPGATFDDARAELATLSAVASHDHAETHRDLRASVLPFAQSWFRLDDPDFVRALRTMMTVVVLLVAVVCVNVATLVYARTATRQTEIAVRSALGATRARIVAQFFGEACVLAGCGSVLGLGFLSFIATRLDRALAEFGFGVLVPFWIRFDVSPSALAYLVGLTFLGAAIIGVLPAVQVTGPRVQLGLQRLAGGHSTIRMGRLWTALILTELAFAVALLPAAARFTGEWLRVATAGPGLPADQYLSTSLAIEGRPPVASIEAAADFRSRFARSRDELLARLDAEPNVVGVTYASSIPGSEGTSVIEADTVARAGSASPVQDGAEQPLFARIADVDRRYFETFEVPVVAGRAFVPADADSAASTVVVNRGLVESVFHGANAIGRRVRMITYTKTGREPGPWYEVIGVVGDFPAELPFPGIPRAAIYRASNIGRAYPVSLTLRLRGDAGAYAGRLRSLAATVQPDFLLAQVAPLEDRLRAQQVPLQWLALSLAVVTASVLVLSCAGVYALMSVVVTQRRREIGIRAAMGADPRRLLWAVFSRASAQVGAGVAIGIGAAALLDRILADGEMLGAHRLAILVGVSVAMGTFAMLAALAPARIALRISPIEALKVE